VVDREKSVAALHAVRLRVEQFENRLNDVSIKINLPDGIELAGDDNGVRSLGKLAVGQEQTIGWVVQPKWAPAAIKKISIVGSAKEYQRAWN